MKKQVGIFSGSFNPIHVGHMILANYMQQFTYLDEVWIVVTPQNPLKKLSELLNDDLRLAMTKLATDNYDNLKVCDIEFKMPIPSYTIDTLHQLSSQYPDYEFTLIIGGDNWEYFDKWKDYQTILREYKIIIYPRLGETIEIEEQYKDTVKLVTAPIVEVSSTFIRNNLREGKEMRAFVPEKVYDYILNDNLYK